MTDDGLGAGFCKNVKIPSLMPEFFKLPEWLLAVYGFLSMELLLLLLLLPLPMLYINFRFIRIDDIIIVIRPTSWRQPSLKSRFTQKNSVLI
jgi:hypothetical protein